MLLQRLVEYAHRSSDLVAPSGYMKSPVTWIVPLGPMGELQGSPVRAVGRGGKSDRRLLRFVPHRLRTSSSIRPKLLADTAEYVLGVPKDASSKKTARALVCRRAFVELVRRCAKRTSEPSVNAVLAFLHGLPESMRAIEIPKDLSPSDIVTFRVVDEFPIDLPLVRKFWSEFFWKTVLAGEAGDEFDDSEQEISEAADLAVDSTPRAVGEMQCVLCGKSARPAPRHPFQIKGLAGRRAGATFVSANVAAFESYGLKNSLVAPTCKKCTEAYAKGANLLIEGEAEGTSLQVGLCTYIFWSREPVEFRVAAQLSSPEPSEVKELVDSARTGRKEARQLDETPFYAAALTANISRVVVRDWLETTIGTAKRNLARWFRLHALVGEWGELDAPPLPLKGYKLKSGPKWVEGLAESTVPYVRRVRDPELVSTVVFEALLRTALNGRPLPTWLLYEAVKRNRAEQSVTRPRAALIKMVLLSQTSWNLEEDLEQLNSAIREPAYLCGKLMWVLEHIELRAVYPKTTITDRFYCVASTAPATVFPTLVRRAKAHLRKLRKDKPGTSRALETKIQTVVEHLPAFPKSLSLEKQGLFCLGYYHQRAADRAEAHAARQAKETGSTEINAEESEGAANA